MLNQTDLATLINKLEVPVVIGAALDYKKKLQDDVHYALHDMLSDMQPDTALLSIALGVKTIAVRYSGSNSGTEILAMECDRIIHEYGPLWLENARRGHIDNAYLISILENIPEDLETLSEMIALHLTYAAFDSKAVAELCDILQVQADAHAIIAEEFLSVMEMAAVQKAKNRPQFPHGMIAANGTHETGAGTNSNIIRFPA